MTMTRHLSDAQAYREFGGKRVRVLWNPRARIWYVYDFDNDDPIFTTFTLELHTVGVYGELKPKYAPEGTPSFVGTIVAHSIVDPEKADAVKCHPYAPAVLFFGEEAEEDEVERFDHCRRILLDRQRMFADRRPITPKVPK